MPITALAACSLQAAKVQEALSRPGVLEGLLGTEGARWGVGAHRSHFTQHTSVTPGGGILALDSEDANLVAAIDHLSLTHQLRDRKANHPEPISYASRTHRSF
jgi:hypothetical protein